MLVILLFLLIKIYSYNDPAPLLSVFRPKDYMLSQLLCSPSFFLIHHLSQPGALHQGARLICLSNVCLVSTPYASPPTSPTHTPVAPSLCLSLPSCCDHHRSSSSTRSQPSEIEMLRAGTTAPLIKFPRLIPVDPLIALSNQAPQENSGQRPPTQQTIILH